MEDIQGTCTMYVGCTVMFVYSVHLQNIYLALYAYANIMRTCTCMNYCAVL